MAAAVAHRIERFARQRGGSEHRPADACNLGARERLRALIGGPHRDVGIALGQVETLIRYHDVQDDLRIDAAKSDEHRAQEMPEEDVAGGDPQFPEGRRSWPVTLRSKPTIS